MPIRIGRELLSRIQPPARCCTSASPRPPGPGRTFTSRTFESRARAAFTSSSTMLPSLRSNPPPTQRGSLSSFFFRSGSKFQWSLRSELTSSLFTGIISAAEEAAPAAQWPRPVRRCRQLAHFIHNSLQPAFSAAQHTLPHTDARRTEPLARAQHTAVNAHQHPALHRVHTLERPRPTFFPTPPLRSPRTGLPGGPAWASTTTSPCEVCSRCSATPTHTASRLI